MKINKKQTLLLTLTITVLGLLAWQVYVLIHHDMTSTNHVTTPTNPTMTQPARLHADLLAQIAPMQPPLITHQKHYMELVNKYKTIKMQRRLLEEEAAIAAAKQRIASLDKKTNQLTRAKTYLNTTPTIRGHQPAALSQPRVQSYTLDEILLLELPPSDYTVVLKTSDNQHSLEQFAEKYHLGSKAMYYSMHHQGKIQYVLLYDHFNDRSNAHMALARLLVPLRKENPKIQTLEIIQQTIKGRI